jgi:hypothetical protein
MRRTALSTLPLLLMSACASVSNYPLAACKVHANGYVLTMHGIRDNMTHSIVMFLLKPTYEAKLELLVPRISDSVQGSNVVRLDGQSEHFSGFINFSESSVEVSLLHGTVDPQIPFDWNGHYQLAQCIK